MALTKIPGSLLDTASGINGLIYPTSDGTSGQFLKTDGSGNLTFATVTTYTDSDVETYLDGGTSTPTFATATVSGTLTVTGDLDITGDINSYNVTDLDVTDQTITLGAGQTEANSGGSGIIIDGSSASILWDETNDEWDFNKNIKTTGTVNSMTIGASGFTCPTNQNFIINSPNGLRMNIDSNNTGTVENFTIGHNEANTGSNILFRIGEGGKASIGHGASNANLHIGSANATGDTINPALQIGGASTYRLGMYTSTEGAVIENKNGDDGIQFRVKTAGEAMRIDGGTGNVGIGTDSPASLLHLKSTANSVGPTLIFENTNNAQSMNIDYYNNAGAVQSRIGYDEGPAAFSFFSNVSSTAAMYIAYDGTVGIGTTSPSTQLHVYGSNNSAGDLWTEVGAGNIPSITIQNAGTTDNNNAALFFRNDSGMFAAINARFVSHTTDETELRFSTTNSSGTTRERVIIDGDGNVGIGETNPTKLGLTGSSDGKVLALGGDDCQLRLTYTVLHHDHSGNTTTHLRNHYGSLDALARMKLESGYISFHTGTAFTEGMRVDAGGRLLINQTSSNLTYGKLQVSAGGETAGHGGIVGFFDTDVSVGTSNLIQRLMFSGDPDATGGVFIRFSDSNSTLGQITAANGTQCSYGVSSDERLKENIVDASSQLDLINNIRVREFDWKVNGYHEVGMIAQELNTVVPSVVQEGGDDVTEEPWSVDYGKLTPYLIKAVQEQQTIIENLQSRIEALEE